MFIDKSLADQDKVAAWAQDTIENYVNLKFYQAGITKRVRVKEIFKNQNRLEQDCPEGSVPSTTYHSKYLICDSQDGKIRVWVYDITGTTHNFSFAGPTASHVQLTVDQTSLDESDKRVLSHELGHIFGLPDNYFENIPPVNNEVIPIGVSTKIHDIMESTNFDHFDKTSAKIVNSAVAFPPNVDFMPYTTLEYFFMPNLNILKLTNTDGSPLSGAKIEVFPLITRYSSSSPYPEIRISRDVSFEGFTTENGEFNLGDKIHLFNSNVPDSKIGKVVFIRITYNNQTKYTAITASYLNTLYFQGQTDVLILTLPFSNLASYDPNRITILSEKKAVLYGDGTLGVERTMSEEERTMLNQHRLHHLELSQLSNTNTQESIRRLTSASTPTPTPISTLTPTPTPTPTTLKTASPTPTPSPKATIKPTASPTPKPTSTSLLESISRFFSRATPSPTPTSAPAATPTTQTNIYDLNYDKEINAFDAARFLEDWRGGVIKWDFNYDGIQNSIDFALLKKGFI